ncbi:hypothetical protein NST56_06710 [Bacillus sp. FSL R5-0560]|uniref:hypothetical protein n=1 Tax=Bacillus sp. FSL R5-0560 TaxID=2954588 RepID=UPI0030D49B83
MKINRKPARVFDTRNNATLFTGIERECMEFSLKNYPHEEFPHVLVGVNDEDEEEDEYTECPECGNVQLIEYGEMTLGFEKSAKTGKFLRRDKKGYPSWWAMKCRCGWKSETFTE